MTSTATGDIIELHNNDYSNLYNGNRIVLESSEANGHRLQLLNFGTGNSITNSIVMSDDETSQIWSGSDLQLWSRGAIRIMANTFRDGTTGGTQDVLIQGKTIKLIATNAGMISLYTGASESNSSRYNIVFPVLNVGETGTLQVYRAR